VIGPAPVDTMIFDGAPQEIKDGLASIVQKGQMDQPPEIATAALFLASADSGFVTSIELYVDGGTAQV
jgi:NAD(P)-dependent dehydrogenase (short-subunit alcohol dehydrogenase family)